MSEILDHKEFSALKDLLKDKMAALIDTYVRSSDKNMVSIQKGLQNKDCRAIGDNAHAMKSASGNLGLKRLREVLQEIEDMVDNDPPYDAVRKDLHGRISELIVVYQLSRDLILKQV